MKKNIVFALCLCALVFASVTAAAQDINVLSQATYLNSALFKFGGHSLNRRMGDLRRADRGAATLWGGGFYNRYSKSADHTLQTDFYGIEGGMDIDVSGGSPDRLYIGLMGGYMDSLGSIKVDGVSAAQRSSFWGGFYGIWIDEDGWFLALTGRSFAPKSKIYSMQNAGADWDMVAFSFESGREFKYDIDGASFFALEPKLRAVYGSAGGESVSDADYSFRYESMSVLFARAGVAASYARNFGDCGLLEPFIEGGYSRDFSPDAQTSDSRGASRSVELAGGSWDIDAGLNAVFNEKFSFHAYGRYERGSSTTNTSVNAGFRYAFAGALKDKSRCCGGCAATPPPPPPAPVVAAPPAPAPPPAVVAKGHTLHIGDSYFTYNSYAIAPHLRDYLKLQADALKEIDYDKIIITGHTDSRGTAESNQILSRQRAQAVAGYLETLGVPAAKIEYHGAGEGRPIATNATAAGRALNRRVEIKVE